jgi:fibronectin type 3 domain-containing protein
LTINSATISGSAFTLSQTSLPITLKTGQTLSLNVVYNPSAASAATGTLTISSNSTTGTTSTVSLSGTGTAALHHVTLTWNAPSSTPVQVAGYNIYRATGTSTSYARLNASVDAQTSYVDSTVAAGSTYTYYIKSVDGSGVESSPSSPVTVTIP